MSWIHSALTLGPLEPLLSRAGVLVTHGLMPRVLGRQRVPRGALVVAAGHLGTVKSLLVVIAVGRPVKVVARAGLLNALLRGVLRLRGLFIIRDIPFGFDEDNAKSLAGAADAARRGHAVLIFPQRPDDDVGTGAARIASESGAPVLPVMTYMLWRRRSVRRALLVIRRPIPAPPADARSRREFRQRLRRRMRRMGAIRQGPEHRVVLDVVLDDRELWRNPRAVLRAGVRVGRLDDPSLHRLARRAHGIQKACWLLKCSVDDVRNPPGVRAAITPLLLAGPALLGLILCAPVLVLLQLLLLRAPHNRAVARLYAGLLLTVPWGLALGWVGLARFGPVGLLLPALALGGLICCGLFKRRIFRAVAIPGVRRHGARVRTMLARFEAALRQAVAGSKHDEEEDRGVRVLEQLPPPVVRGQQNEPDGDGERQHVR